MQHPFGEVAAAGNGEVPRQHQLVAFDAGGDESGDRRLHRRTPGLDRRQVGGERVAVGAEHRRGLDDGAVGRHQAAQTDSERVALRQRDRRVHDECPVGVTPSLGVELGPQRHPLAGVEIDEHDGRGVRQ